MKPPNGNVSTLSTFCVNLRFCLVSPLILANHSLLFPTFCLAVLFSLLFGFLCRVSFTVWVAVPRLRLCSRLGEAAESPGCGTSERVLQVRKTRALWVACSQPSWPCYNRIARHWANPSRVRVGLGRQTSRTAS